MRLKYVPWGRRRKVDPGAVQKGGKRPSARIGDTGGKRNRKDSMRGEVENGACRGCGG